VCLANMIEFKRIDSLKQEVVDWYLVGFQFVDDDLVDYPVCPIGYDHNIQVRYGRSIIIATQSQSLAGTLIYSVQ
jgi:hypothetical protein